MTGSAWFWIGMLLGGLFVGLGGWLEGRHYAQDNRELRRLLFEKQEELDDAKRWAQVLGASLYDPSTDDTD